MKDHRYRANPRIVRSGAGFSVVHHPGCSCGWQGAPGLPIADIAYQQWERHREEVRRARDEPPAG